jgi:hypothetical protein
MEEESFRSCTIVWCNESRVPVVDPDDAVSRILRTRKTSIYELLHLVHEDWILKKNRSLPTHSRDNSLQRKVKLGTDIRQSQRAGPVHPRLTVDIHDTRALAQESVERGFKPGIPVQDGHREAVDGVEADILIRMPTGKPRRAVPLGRAVDDMGNALLLGEPTS